MTPRPRQKDQHLPRCVYRKHGAYWYVRKGQWTRLPEKGPSTLQSALEAYALIMETPRDGSMPAKIEEALERMKKRKPPLADNTLKQYNKAVQILKRKLKQFNPEQVQQRHIVGIKLAMASTPNMFNQCLSFLRQVFDQLLELQYPGIDNNPAVGVKRLVEGKRTQLPTMEQHNALLAVRSRVGDRQAVIFDLLRLTGQRIIDVISLENADCDDSLPGIRFDPQKTGKPFYAKWTPELREVVARARALRGNVRSIRWLFPGKPDQYGKQGHVSYATVYDAFKRACKAAGIEGLVQHDWRAMALTQAEDEGKDPQKLGRHSSPETTQRYLRGRKLDVVETPTFSDGIRRPIDGGKKKP